jgi:hypothetical protein
MGGELALAALVVREHGGVVVCWGEGGKEWFDGLTGV